MWNFTQLYALIKRRRGPAPLTAFRFGPFRLLVNGRILERDGVRVCLTPKVADLLFVFAQNPDEVVSKETLMRLVWPEVSVVESGLTRNISVLRRALGPDGEIETVPRRGYRFRAEVTLERAPVPPSFLDSILKLFTPTAIESGAARISQAAEV
ncbi:MAG: transcriptional regulator [Acidobacteria bacterium]|nr:transcriptional regulator [Acidobacteriota bacterium]